MNQWLIGIDLGGTTIKCAFISLKGEIMHKWKIPTDTTDGGKNIIPDLIHSIKEKMKDYQLDKKIIKGIGLGVPAFLNMKTGFIYKAVNLGWRNMDVKAMLEQMLELPVVIDNDANVAAIGEMWKGAGAQSKNILCVTIGTGIGGGIIINGDIIHGVNGMAGEIGHIIVLPENGEPCNCGNKGCLETVSSATGIVRMAMKRLQQHPDSIVANMYRQHGLITARMITEAAQMDDQFALEIIRKATYYLGLAIANIANTINPEKIIIGGGVSKAGAIIMDPLSQYFKQFTIPRVYEATQLTLATLGNDAGVLGGAWLAKNKL